ncbi:MAG TPA: aldo/keto reductase [Kribbellaceae bacterium]
MWTRDIEAEVAPVCAELGIGVVPYSPLGRGFLTGAIKSADALEAGDFRAMAQPRFAAGNLEHNLAVVRALEAVAAERGVTAGQLALAWVQHRGDHVVPIPGTTRRTYLEQNVAAADLELSAGDLAAIEAAVPADAIAGTRYAEQHMASLDL